MKQMIIGLVLATVAGCVEGVASPGPDLDPEDPGEAGEPTAPGLVQDPPPADSPEWARCEAAVMRLALDDGTCVARVSVRFDCSEHTQKFTWARVGVLAGDNVLGAEDYEYTCRSTIVHVFAISCDDELELGAAATFDHPQTAEDVSCASAAFHRAP